MFAFEKADPYSEIAVLGLQEFELRSDELVVPLFFRPDAACITRAVLEQEDEFTREVIVERPDFKETCEGTYPVHRFMAVFSDLRFTFNALGSMLVQVAYKRGTANVYVRNPNYKVTDEHNLLSTAK